MLEKIIKIKQYEELGLKPAQMLIQLRKDTTKIPSQLQLNNYLKDLRKNLDGQLGTKIRLNDFIYFHQRRKEILEDPDQMFVENCEVNVINIEGYPILTIGTTDQ